MTSGVITTLGLMVGLHSGTHSKAIVIGGIMTIAIADAFSDALGIHISKESENSHTHKEIWIATIATFISKFFFSMTFVIPVFLMELRTAIIVSIIWGISVLSSLCYAMAKSQGKNPVKFVFEHLLIAIAVIICTHFIGDLISLLTA
jgi:VIT1/CCC1 family predicted Fe2+/Mn2+ transporter